MEGQESQASSCVEEWNSACLSSCSWDDRPLVELWNYFWREGTLSELSERLEMFYILI